MFLRLLPDALGKSASPMCAMMPERLAATDPFKQVTEMVGSGPFRFKADERVPAAHNAYERFAGYKPRAGHAIEKRELDLSGRDAGEWDRIVSEEVEKGLSP